MAEQSMFFTKSQFPNSNILDADEHSYLGYRNHTTNDATTWGFDRGFDSAPASYNSWTHSESDAGDRLIGPVATRETIPARLKITHPIKSLKSKGLTPERTLSDYVKTCVHDPGGHCCGASSISASSQILIAPSTALENNELLDSYLQEPRQLVPADLVAIPVSEQFGNICFKPPRIDAEILPASIHCTSPTFNFYSQSQHISGNSSSRESSPSSNYPSLEETHHDFITSTHSPLPSNSQVNSSNVQQAFDCIFDSEVRRHQYLSLSCRQNSHMDIDTDRNENHLGSTLSAPCITSYKNQQSFCAISGTTPDICSSVEDSSFSLLPTFHISLTTNDFVS
jgi:hypothetical protein